MSSENEAFPEIQVKEDLREHVLARPDTYLGSFIYDKYKTYVVEGKKVEQKVVEYNPAFERCVIEIGSNCIDNVWRSRQFGVTCGSIRFEYTEDGTLSFWNDGLTIPIVKSKIEKLKDMYNPSIVFGVYMSSTNYNDSEKRRSSGRNGYGSKLSNTMSKRFQVDTQDEKLSLHFSQVWYDNMERKDPAVVVAKKGKGYTKVTWLPDYNRFKMPGLTPPVIGLLKKYLYDVAMITKIPVYMNGELIPVRSLVDYAQAFSPSQDVLHIETIGSEVVVVPARPSLTIAFTNGIPNPDGGVHVDAWSRAIFSPLTGKINPKADEKETSKAPKLTMAEVKAHFSIFIVCSLDNPTFNSQEKAKLTAPKPETTFKVSQLNKMMKWSVIARIKDMLDSKLLRAQKKKLEGTKKGFKNIKKLEDANLAGTARSQECILLYCEGDSAKTYAVTGIQKGIGEKVGRDYFGILPCGGKILNVRKAKAEKVVDNAAVQALTQALGVEIGVDYTIEANFRKLRYGNIMIISDADDDGTHIEGLCQNFFHKLHPTLLQRDPPFLTSMRTPIVRVALKGGEEKKFYRMKAFKEFQETHSKQFKEKPKHFKGLGTSTDRQVIDTFGDRVVFYIPDDMMNQEMDKAFASKQTTARKEWISGHDPEKYLILEDEEAKEITTTFSDFINTELINFSIANCARSLPHVIDGLKESQRKILYTLITKKMTHDKPSKKVYGVAGIVAGETEYIHGEQCLGDTIVGMAWDFMGSNNIPLLDPDGQFGSRLLSGDDAASTRYIFTRLQEITPYIFREEDNPILSYIQGEDIQIEPTFYVPILPMILVNGIRGGIGTGYSSNVPAHNPLDIIRCLRVWIKQNLDELKSTGNIIISDLPEISPWYQGFTGEMSKTAKKVWNSHGVVRKLSDTSSEVTELPVGYSTDKFREKLKELREKEMIADFADYCSKSRVKFIIHEFPEKLSCSVKSLKLTKSHGITNMVAFNPEGKIQKYTTVDEIIYDFAQIRLKFYGKRKDYLVKTLEKKEITLSAKRRFVEEVISKKIEIYRKKRAEIVSSLTEGKYPIIDGKYDYLLKMPIDSFTEEMIHKLDGMLSSLRAELEKIKSTTTRDMWWKELDEFEGAYSKYQKKWAANEALINSGKEKPTKIIRRGRK